LVSHVKGKTLQVEGLVTIRLIKSRTGKWVEHVKTTAEERIACRVIVGGLNYRPYRKM